MCTCIITRDRRVVRTCAKIADESAAEYDRSEMRHAIVGLEHRFFPSLDPTSIIDFSQLRAIIGDISDRISPRDRRDRDRGTGSAHGRFHGRDLSRTEFDASME